MRKRSIGVAGGLLLAAGALLAQAPPEERIPIMAPGELAALGLPRDAGNVFRWSKADPGRGRAAAAPATEAPQTWGTASGYTTGMGYELRNERGLTVKEPDRTFCPLWFGGAGQSASTGVIQLQFPDGAKLGQLQFWAYDEDPDYGLTFDVYEYCNAVGFGSPVTTLIGSADTFGAIGYYYGFTPLNGYRVNNRDCGYTVRVTFIAAGTQCRSDKLQLQKVSVSWVRDVSPAPASASFTDVPKSHPFFQFVEALAKSGITGGCGGGKFCPDNALTRGQMAVFLAKGLGLSWP